MSSDELPDELPDEMQYELPDELISELDNVDGDADGNTILYIVNFRGTTLYYLSESIKHKTPIISENQFDKFEKNSNPLTCPICMEDSDENIVLPCTHVFCSSCIKKWLLKNKNTCPNCRKSVM
jgi:hypothetical protein